MEIILAKKLYDTLLKSIVNHHCKSNAVIEYYLNSDLEEMVTENEDFNKVLSRCDNCIRFFRFSDDGRIEKIYFMKLNDNSPNCSNDECQLCQDLFGFCVEDTTFLLKNNGPKYAQLADTTIIPLHNKKNIKWVPNNFMIDDEFYYDLNSLEFETEEKGLASERGIFLRTNRPSTEDIEEILVKSNNNCDSIKNNETTTKLDDTKTVSTTSHKPEIKKYNISKDSLSLQTTTQSGLSKHVGKDEEIEDKSSIHVCEQIGQPIQQSTPHHRFSEAVNTEYLRVIFATQSHIMAHLYVQQEEDQTFSRSQSKNQMLLSLMGSFFGDLKAEPGKRIKCDIRVNWLKDIYEKITKFLQTHQVLTFCDNQRLNDTYDAVLVLSSDASALIRHENLTFLTTLRYLLNTNETGLLILVEPTG